MKRLNHLSENTFLKLFFSYFSLCFLVAAFFMPDRADMLPGFWRILNSPTKASTNFFSVGGYAATFLNMGLVHHDRLCHRLPHQPAGSAPGRRCLHPASALRP
ncbi:MAG: DUF1576 domain-containing protein [Oscillospiraceae bacterium]|nr:DUF1576 domain-containing protein [Oscillospiraceae bacterium]